MLTTAGATFLTSGAKVRPICSREVGTVCAAAGPAANSRTAANARAQRRKRRSSIDEDLTRTAKGSRTPAASHLSPSCQGLAWLGPGIHEFVRGRMHVRSISDDLCRCRHRHSWMRHGPARAYPAADVSSVDG